MQEALFWESVLREACNHIIQCTRNTTQITYRHSMLVAHGLLMVSLDVLGAFLGDQCSHARNVAVKACVKREVQTLERPALTSSHSLGTKP